MPDILHFFDAELNQLVSWYVLGDTVWMQSKRMDGITMQEAEAANEVVLLAHYKEQAA